MDSSRIVVIGAALPLATQVVHEALRRGMSVVAHVDSIDDASHLPKEAVRRVGELGDARYLQRLFEGAGAVVLSGRELATREQEQELAAARDVKGAQAEPTTTGAAAENAAPTVSALAPESLKLLVECAAEAGVKRIVLLSTGEIYAAARGPIDESAPRRALMPAELRLIAAEDRLLELCRDNAPSLTILRPGVVYGPRVRGLAATLATVPILFARSSALLPGFRGGPRGSWVHASDVAAAVFFVLGRSDCGGQAFNVADETPVAAGEVLTYLTAAQELPIGALVAWPPLKLLQTLLPLASRPCTLRLLDGWLGLQWKKVREDYGLPSSFTPRIDPALLEWACFDMVLATDRIKQLGFKIQWASIYEGLAENVDALRHERILPDLRGVERLGTARSPLHVRFQTHDVGYAIASADGSRRKVDLHCAFDAPARLSLRRNDALIDGSLSIAGFVEAALFEGTASYRPLQRRIVYEMGFRGPEGRAYRFVGEQHLELAPWLWLESLTTLPYEILDDHGRLAFRGQLRFRLDDELGPTLTSLRLGQRR